MASCALVASADFNEPYFREAYDRNVYDVVIAVDGGYAYLEALGVHPDLIVGDFDSLGYVPEGDNVEAYPTRKDETDLELALRYAADHGCETLAAYAVLGGRLDHTIGNIQLLARYAEECGTVSIIGIDEELRFLVGPAVYELPDVPGGKVSVFSLAPESFGVTEEGLEYPLHDVVLNDRTAWGLSNVLLDEQAFISVQEGTLLVFHPLVPPVA